MLLLILLLAAFTIGTSAVAPPADLPNFLLITSSSSFYFANSSTAPDVSAMSLFDPYHQATMYLRFIGPGYGSLPRFNLTAGKLVTTAIGLTAGGFAKQEYNMVTVKAGKKLALDPTVTTYGSSGTLELKDGYLLSVAGQSDG